MKKIKKSYFKNDSEKKYLKKAVIISSVFFLIFLTITISLIIIRP